MFSPHLLIQCGQVEPGTTTVLAIGPAGGKQLDEVTGHLKTLPDCLQLITLPCCEIISIQKPKVLTWNIHVNLHENDGCLKEVLAKSEGSQQFCCRIGPSSWRGTTRSSLSVLYHLPDCWTTQTVSQTCAENPSPGQHGMFHSTFGCQERLQKELDEEKRSLETFMRKTKKSGCTATSCEETQEDDRAVAHPE